MAQKTGSCELASHKDVHCRKKLTTDFFKFFEKISLVVTVSIS